MEREERGMLHRFRQGMEKWGHYLLALLCAAVILLSAVWTRDHKNTEKPAAADQSQTLGEAKAEGTSAPPALVRPVEGAVRRAFCADMKKAEKNNLWSAHPSLDFSAAPGDRVLAMASGRVFLDRDGLWLEHTDGRKSRYRGLQTISVSPGQEIQSGGVLGTAGGFVPFEGTGIVCVTLYEQNTPIPFGEEWIESSVP